jgi:hypothetical protein
MCSGYFQEARAGISSNVFHGVLALPPSSPPIETERSSSGLWERFRVTKWLAPAPVEVPTYPSRVTRALRTNILQRGTVTKKRKREKTTETTGNNDGTSGNDEWTGSSSSHFRPSVLFLAAFSHHAETKRTWVFINHNQNDTEESHQVPVRRLFIWITYR